MWCHLVASSENYWFVYYQKVENEEISSQMVGMGLVKSVTKMATGWLRMTKVAILVVLRLKVFLAKYKKCGTRPFWVYPEHWTKQKHEKPKQDKLIQCTFQKRLTECYYTFNYKDHCDPGLFYMLHNIVEWCCISRPAIKCLVLYVSTS